MDGQQEKPFNILFHNGRWLPTLSNHWQHMYNHTHTHPPLLYKHTLYTDSYNTYGISLTGNYYILATGTSLELV